MLFLQELSSDAAVSVCIPDSLQQSHKHFNSCPAQNKLHIVLYFVTRFLMLPSVWRCIHPQ